MNKSEKIKQEKTGTDATHVAVTPAHVGLSAPENKDMKVGFAVWVRVLLQNWRQGTVGCKTRSEVARSTKKPWKQKGTGRARAGSARSPVWRGGGGVFGPQPRVRTLKVSKKQKNGVLHGLIYEYLAAGKVRMLDEGLMGLTQPSTARAHKLLKTHELHDRKTVLFLPVGDMVH